MIDISKIKLIIWDLDETLWKGIITEESICISDDTVEFLKNTLDMGIVHSICSKNDLDVVKSELERNNLWEYFVFPSVDWSPKGERIKGIIEKMALRPCNVLFVDDNIQNLKEAEFYCKDIMTALPEDILPLYLIAQKATKNDTDHKRLQQYKILEQKHVAKKEFTSNNEFLMSCGIKVEITNDCINELDRIYELMMRSNQLNYTKFRQDKDELEKLLKDESYKCGAVKVKDKFGDYGLVGFYAIKDNKAVHFAFSCRTLGMLVEQYVYKTIGCPQIDIKGDVVTVLNNKDMPQWINAVNNLCENSCKQRDSINKKVLLKGPCDMLQVFSFIKKTDNIITEFSYTNNNGVFVEGNSHTAVIATALTISDEDKKQALDDGLWLDDNILSTSLKTEKYDTVILSLLADCNLGVYKHKKTGAFISVCEGYYPLTCKENYKGYITGDLYNSNIKFTEEILTEFSKRYDFISNNGDLTIESLQTIYDHIPQSTNLVLILGSEVKCDKDVRKSYCGRHNVHSEFNKKIMKWADNKCNVSTINLTKYIQSENDYTDSINHFTKEIYYKLTQDIVSAINQNDCEIQVRNRISILISIAKDVINKLLRR